MGYKIKVKNKIGTYITKPYKTKKQAQNIIKSNKLSDKKVNESGLRRISDGKLMKITNKYRLIKDR